MEVDGPHYSVMRGRVVFGEVVAKVVVTFGPVDEELTLVDTVADPVEAHVHGFGATLGYGVIGDAGGCTIVRLDRSGALREAEFLERIANGTGLFAVVEDSGGFSFGGGGDDLFEDMCWIQNGGVLRWRWIVRFGRLGGIGGAIAEEEVAGPAGASFRFGKVGGIAVDPQVHVAGNEA